MQTGVRHTNAAAAAATAHLVKFEDTQAYKQQEETQRHQHVFSKFLQLNPVQA